MSSSKINEILIPNISKLPSDKKIDLTSKINNEVDKDEFKKLLKGSIEETKFKYGINLSLHAAKRIKERNIDLSGDEIIKLKKGISQLKSKGGQDSLIITQKGAYIVDVSENKIVTALDRENMNGNVFTKIDSTLIVN